MNGTHLWPAFSTNWILTTLDSLKILSTGSSTLSSWREASMKALPILLELVHLSLEKDRQDNRPSS
jgi:hypothetical protein